MKRPLLILCGLLLFSTQACANSVPVAFTRLEISGGLTRPAELVVRDIETFRRIWDEMQSGQQPKPNLPEIDFTREMVIIVAFGQKPNGGYSIGVQDIQEENHGVEVTVAKLSPGPNCWVIQILTAPVDVVRLKKIAKPVVFKDREVVYQCK